MRKIYLYGGGVFLRNRIDNILSLPGTEIMGIVDNNPALQGTEINGISITSPHILKDTNYDYVVVTSVQDSIWDDIRQIDISDTHIMSYEQYYGACYKGYYQKYEGLSPRESENGKSIILITVGLGSNGGTIAAEYALISLQNKGYRTSMVSPWGDLDYIRNLNREGITVYVYPNLKFENLSGIPWLTENDGIIINTYQMHHCITCLPSQIPAIWWIHESPVIYNNDIKIYGKMGLEIPDNVKVFCVSKRAQQNLSIYYPSIPTGILEYGIPDRCTKNERALNKELIRFGIIGAVSEIKGQDILLHAISLLKPEILNKTEFLIIGNINDTYYGRLVKKMAENLPMVKIVGSVPHEELMEIITGLDVVVCPSRQDSLPIAITEGLMMGKVCIISDAIGVMKYVKPDKDVLTFRTENVEDLADKISLVVNNPILIDRISLNARGVYERTFTMSHFANRLERALFG